MIFGREDYTGRIVECDMTALKELLEDVISDFQSTLSHNNKAEWDSYRLRFANCFYGKIPAQEPVWLLRGGNRHGSGALRALAHWSFQAGEIGPSEYDETMHHADLMEAWARESIDEICGLCGYRRGDHRSERWAHHSECTVEAFVVRVDKSIGNHEDRPSKVPVSQLRRSSVERTRKRRGKAFNEATVQLPMPKMY